MTVYVETLDWLLRFYRRKHPKVLTVEGRDYRIGSLLEGGPAVSFRPRSDTEVGLNFRREKFLFTRYVTAEVLIDGRVVVSRIRGPRDITLPTLRAVVTQAFADLDAEAMRAHVRRLEEEQRRRAEERARFHESIQRLERGP